MTINVVCSQWSPWWRVAVFMGLCALLGVVTQYRDLRANYVIEDAVALIRGDVTSFPSWYQDGHQYEIHVDQMWRVDRWVDWSQQVLIRHQLQSKPGRGDYIEARVHLNHHQRHGGQIVVVRQPDDWLVIKPSLSAWYKKCEQARWYWQQDVNVYMDQSHAELLTAMVIGDRAQLSFPTKMMLKRVGLYHVAIVSGFHIAFIFYLFSTAARWIYRWLLPGSLLCPIWIARASAGVMGAAIYLSMINVGVSSLRASLFLFYGVVSVALGRTSNLIYGALVMAAVMIAIDIDYIKDIGFQLSFAAVLGIYTVLSLIKPGPDAVRSSSRSWRQSIQSHGYVCLGAYVATAPILAYYFSTVSFVAPVVNFTLLPILLPLLAVGFVAYLLHVPTVSYLDEVLRPIANYLLVVVDGVLRLVVSVLNEVCSWSWVALHFS